MILYHGSVVRQPQVVRSELGQDAEGSQLLRFEKINNQIAFCTEKALPTVIHLIMDRFVWPVCAGTGRSLTTI